MTSAFVLSPQRYVPLEKPQRRRRVSAAAEHLVPGPCWFPAQRSFRQLDGRRNGYTRKSALLLIAATALLLPQLTAAASSKEVRRALFSIFSGRFIPPELL